MISQETAVGIATAHREIRVARELLDKIEAGEREGRPPDIADYYGRPRGLQLGVPTSDTTQRLFTVSHAAAKLILADHIERQRAEIERLSGVALAEVAAAGGGTVVFQRVLEIGDVDAAPSQGKDQDGNNAKAEEKENEQK